MVKKAKIIDQIMYMSLFSTIGIIINNIMYYIYITVYSSMHMHLCMLNYFSHV